jgi:preprotein translocase subunit SecY
MDSKNLNILQKIIVIVIAAIAAFFYISIMKNTDEAGGSIDGMLRFTYIILVIALIGTVLVWLKDILLHPKKLIQTLIFVGIFVLIVLFAKYGLASNEPVQYANGMKIDGNTSNWVDTGLFTFYILAAIAILLMFLSPVLSLVSGNGSNASDVIEEEYNDNEEINEADIEDEE